jgi:hypothetical protein
LSQQPLFVPASDGWYARPGDPPGIVRHWDGKKWQCEFRGPIKDHFNYLRSMPAEARTDADRDLMKKLTSNVSDIEDLVLGDPSSNPPLVQIAAPPPYIPPPVASYGTGPSPKAPSYGAPPPVVPVFMGPQPTPPLGMPPMAQPMPPIAQAPMAYLGQAPVTQPYPGQPATQPYAVQPATQPYIAQQPATQPYIAQPATQPYIAQQPPGHPPMQQAYAPAHGQPGPSATPGGTPRFSTPRKKRSGWLRVGLIVGLVAVVGVALRFGVTTVAGSTLFSSTSAALAVSSCVTLSYPSGATDEKSVSWAKSDCTTTADGPVSYIIVSKLAGAAQCDPDSQFVQTFSTGSTVTYTYCLMENLTVGQCVYEDGKGFLFDVPCSDTRALAKVSQRVDRGSGVDCAAGEGSWRFPAGNRTYCLSKP